MITTLVIHETDRQAIEHERTDPGFMGPRMRHTSLGAAVMGGPYETVIYTHGAVMALCESERLMEWARDTVASRVRPCESSGRVGEVALGHPIKVSKKSCKHKNTAPEPANRPDFTECLDCGEIW